MKKIYSFVTGLMLLCTAANAQQIGNYETCEPRNFCEDLTCGFDFTVYVDYLYWQTCRSDLTFTDLLNDYHSINPGYSSGWRIGGRVQKDNWDLGFKYTSFTPKETIHPKGGNFANDFRARHDADWDIVDIETGYSLYHDCGQAMLRPFAGVKLAWVDETREVNTTRDKIDFDACGLYTGMEGRFMVYNAQICDMCLPLYLVGRGSIGVLDATFKQARTVGDTISTEHAPQCIFVPVLEGFVGLEIGGAEFCNVKPYVMLGYEVQSWLTKAFNSNDRTAHVGLGGLVARLGLDF